MQLWDIQAPYFLESAAFYVRNVSVKSRRKALKKRGITFAELEMPVTAHLKVCSLVRIFHGFQHLLDVRNPPHLTYQQIMFSPPFRNEECRILFQCHCYPAPEETKRQKKKKKQLRITKIATILKSVMKTVNLRVHRARIGW